MNTHFFSVLIPFVIACSVGCGGHVTRPSAAPEPSAAKPGSASTAPRPEVSVLPADTAITTQAGAAFTAPKGWTMTKSGADLRFDEPNRELTVFYFENEPRDAEVAIAQAWKQAVQDFGRKVKQTVKAPPRDGWDEIVQTDYETAPQESRAVLAVARRKGSTWHVVLVDGALAGLSRRGAQLMTMLSSLRPKGGDKESFAGKEAAPLDQAKLAAFEQFVEAARAQAQVPGVAVAVVQGGKVVFEKGFGVRELGKKQAVTPRTLFMIGSTTKALTSLLMAKLVDQDKLTWDTPMVQLLPEFGLGDPAIAAKVLLRHTVCACTGMPRQDMEFLFEYAGVTAEQRLAQMKTMVPTTGFGETFQYSNALVSAGGYAAARVFEPQKSLAAAYGAAMKSEVFAPLGMRATTFDLKAVKKAEHATPHGVTLAFETVPVSIGNEEGVVSVGPAGAAWSSALDMAQYVLLELGQGAMPGGKRIVSEASLLERRKPGIKITDDLSYGLGLFVEKNCGVPIVHHGGNTTGFSSDLFFLPDHGVGAVVLTNGVGMMAGPLTSAIRRRLLELLFDGRSEAAQNLDFSLRVRSEDAQKEQAQLEANPDRAWLERLAGVYSNKSLGKIAVRLQGQQVVLDAGEWRSVVAVKRELDGTKSLVVTTPPLTGLGLVLEEKDGRIALLLDAAQQKYLFEPLSEPKK